MASSHEPLGVAVVGAGYWGPNLIRNFESCEATELRWVCDLSIERARGALGRHSTVGVTDKLEAVLADPAVEGVAVATPVSTHADVVMVCLRAGKHVIVEKPLAASVEEGHGLIEEAERSGLVLMCDHTYCYTPAVTRLRSIMQNGDLGDLQYVDSVRINLGLVQTDTDVIWDLAPHDLSILDFVLDEASRPTAVAAQGADPMGVGRACVAFVSLPLQGGAIAHLHVNWLSPTKIRTTVIGGSRRTAVWDDLHPTQRISIYDRGVDLAGPLSAEARRESLISYRIGDIFAPALPETEALQGVVSEFAAAVREKRPALTDGHSGLRVLSILEAASRSLESNGALVPLELGT